MHTDGPDCVGPGEWIDPPGADRRHPLHPCHPWLWSAWGGM